jgi:hypothetical protein
MEDLHIVAQRVEAALRRVDWNAFRRDATPTVAFVQYVRAYHGEYPPALYDRQFALGGFPKYDDDDKPGVPRAHRMSVSAVLVDTSRPLGRVEKRLFHDFCGGVVESYGRVEVGENVADADESPFLFGPAARFKVASNEEVRVAFERMRGRWKVRSLITALH